MIVDKNLEFGFINLYCGKTSTLSSCCFAKDEAITVQKNGENSIILLKDFVEQHLPSGYSEIKLDTGYLIDSMNSDGYLEKSKIVGVLKKLNDSGKIINISAGNQSVSVTPDHIFKCRTYDGKESEISSAIMMNLIQKSVPLYIPVKIGSELEWKNIDLIEQEDYNGYVYDIELESNHYFPANKIISHNCRLRSDTVKTEYEIEDENGEITLVNSGRVVNVKLPDGTETSMTIEEIINSEDLENITILSLEN